MASSENRHREMSDGRTSINVKQNVRDELRRFKADDGLTYDEAIVRLLNEVDWIDDGSELIEILDDANEDTENNQ
jgi:hypothetical protein